MEVTNGYQHWKEIFMAHEPTRKEAGIETIYTGMEAQKEFLPLQEGDVPDTYADVTDLIDDLDYKPSMTVNEGVRRFVEWYMEYNKNG